MTDQETSSNSSFNESKRSLDRVNHIFDAENVIKPPQKIKLKSNLKQNKPKWWTHFHSRKDQSEILSLDNTKPLKPSDNNSKITDINIDLPYADEG